MAGAGKKWLIGCGIGCGFFILIMGGIGTVGYFGVKGFVDRADKIEATNERMGEEFGRPAEFVPEIDGTVPAGRMEIFLAVRDETSGVQEEVSDLFQTLDGENDYGTIDRIKAGIKFIPSLFVFIEERNRIMMDHGMGVGEYQYIYSLAYYSLLDVDLSDGPGFVITSDEDESEDQDRWSWDVNTDEDDEEETREKRERRVRHFVNRVQSQVVRNQLEALDAQPGNLQGLDFDVWRAELADEVAAMDRESLRMLWEEGLPDQIRASLEPYRDRLAATYDEMTSVLEMGLVDEY